MKKNKTKSILACAVLASVFAGGIMPSVAQASTFVSNLQDSIGATVYFGKQFEMVDGEFKAVVRDAEQIPAEWEIVNHNNGTATLLAKYPWAHGNASTYVEFLDYEETKYPELLFHKVLSSLIQLQSGLVAETYTYT